MSLIGRKVFGNLLLYINLSFENPSSFSLSRCGIFATRFLLKLIKLLLYEITLSAQRLTYIEQKPAQSVRVKDTVAFSSMMKERKTINKDSLLGD